MCVLPKRFYKKNEVVSQLSLFEENNDESREKRKKSEKAVDNIRQKYGYDSIIKGAVINTDIGIYKAHKKDDT